MTDAELLAAAMAAELDEIERTYMPFGKFGPDHFPPNGRPDLRPVRGIPRLVRAESGGPGEGWGT